MKALRAVVALALVGAGCSFGPKLVPLPEQYPAIDRPDPPDTRWFIAMSEQRADQFIRSGIPPGQGAGERRWTNEAPSLRFTLPRADGWTAALDLEFVDVTMRDTGPVTVSVAVNGTAIGELRCERPGRYQFRGAVPAGAVRAGAETVLSAAVDQPWIAKADAAKLGFLLYAGGFLRE
jgi:hypothetical protein